MTPEQIAALAAGFGLDPATATEADIMAASAAAAEAAATPPPEVVPIAPVPEPEAVPVAASAEARTVTVTAAQWQETQDRLARTETDLQARRETEQRTHRDGLIAAAVMDGRIAPSERDQWRTDLDDAPEATERILARLTPNRIPVQARGVDRQEGVNEGGGTDAEHAAFMASMGVRPNRRDVDGVTMVSDMTGVGL